MKNAIANIKFYHDVKSMRYGMRSEILYLIKYMVISLIGNILGYPISAIVIIICTLVVDLINFYSYGRYWYGKRK